MLRPLSDTRFAFIFVLLFTSPLRAQETPKTGGSADRAVGASADWRVRIVKRETVEFSELENVHSGVVRLVTKGADRLLKLTLMVEPLRPDTEEKLKKELGDFTVGLSRIKHMPEKGTPKAFNSARVRLVANDGKLEARGYFKVVGDLSAVFPEKAAPITSGFLYNDHPIEMILYVGVTGPDENWVLCWYDVPPLRLTMVPALSTPEKTTATGSIPSSNTPIPTVHVSMMFRLWSDSTGTFKVTAKPVSVADGKVTLEKENGKLIEVPIDRLSKPDQVFLKMMERFLQKPSN